jgi:hypothetical protein
MSNLFRVPNNAVESLPDTDRYKCRFKVRSESSNSLYLIAFDAAPGATYWTCSCRGNIAHGQCKHLTACGLKGRKFGKDLETKRQFELGGK